MEEFPPPVVGEELGKEFLDAVGEVKSESVLLIKPPSSNALQQESSQETQKVRRRETRGCWSTCGPSARIIFRWGDTSWGSRYWHGGGMWAVSLLRGGTL